MKTILKKKQKTNSEALVNTSIYDILVGAHHNLGRRNCVCILEALDDSLCCVGKEDTCETCIQRFLNQPYNGFIGRLK